MLQYYIMCRSLTYAQRAAWVLERAGITAILTRAPRSISNEGCVYCVKVSEKRLAEALKALKRAGFDSSRIYVKGPDGSLAEVRK